MTNKNKGMWLTIFSALFFALGAAMVKFGTDITVYQKVFARGLVSAMFPLYALLRKEFVFRFERRYQRDIWSRSIFGLIAATTYYYSIENMPLADAVTINKMAPVYILIFSYFLLRESINKIQILSIGIAFLGAVFILRPSFNMNIVPGIAGVVSGITSGYAFTIVRKLSSKVHPLSIVLHFSIVMCVGAFPFMMINFTIPSLRDMLVLLLLGLFAALGQIFMTYSYRYAKASEISIYHYMSVFFSAVIGFISLSEIPTIYSAIGMLLVILSGYVNYLVINKKPSVEE